MQHKKVEIYQNLHQQGCGAAFVKRNELNRHQRRQLAKQCRKQKAPAQGQGLECIQQPQTAETLVSTAYVGHNQHE